MIELALVGRSPDGKELFLIDENGTEYSVEITDELVAKVFVAPDLPGADNEEPLSPGEIQTLLREGLSPEQIASQTGTPIERVRRYRRPVIAEINHAIAEATNSRVGTEIDAPTMGDLVVDRLAARDVDTDSLSWNAHRNRRGHWEVAAHYELDGEPKVGRWELSSTGLTARNAVAKELTETKREEPDPTRSFFPLSAPAEVEQPPSPVGEDTARAEELVDELNARRGKRVPLMEEIDGEAETFPVAPQIPAPSEEDMVAGSLPAERDVPDEERPTLDEAIPTRSGKSKRKGRSPIPSWDEIVFGTRD